MKPVLVTLLAASVALTPSMSLAQHGGRGGGGWSGGSGGFGARGASGSWSGGQGWASGHGSGGFGGGGRTASNSSGSRGPASFHPTHAASPHQFNFSHRPAYHGNWYHGDWHGHWGHPWAYRPWGWYWGGGLGWGFGFGLGVATVGVLTLGSPWGWGYYSYWNPYWVAPVGGVTYINYSQPIIYSQPAVVAPQPSPGAPIDSPLSGGGTAQEKALAMFDSARALFKRGDYPMALAETNRAVALLPNDSILHEFRALCLFVMKDYQQSAAAMYAVLSVGPGWDWATLSGLYPNPSVYEQQLRALEGYRRDNPAAAPARFLLAYHYLLAGHNQQAAAELQAVVELEPKDQLAAQLLKGLTAAPTNDEPPTTPPALLPASPVDASSLIGHWTGNRSDGSHFELNLTRDNKFTWEFTQQNKKQRLNGNYTLADNYLILTASDQNALVGHVALEQPNQLTFKLAGGSPADPGLTFTR